MATNKRPSRAKLLSYIERIKAAQMFWYAELARSIESEDYRAVRRANVILDEAALAIQRIRSRIAVGDYGKEKRRRNRAT